MKKMMVQAVWVFLSLSAFATGPNIAFPGTKFVDAKGHETEANLIFDSNQKSLVVLVAAKAFAEIPYSSIDKVSYEYSKHHRLEQGAIVMVASLGAGAVVMLTKSKSHWLYVDYHEGVVAKTLVLRMDKKEYKQILQTAKAETGKEVEVMGEAGKPEASK